jgi:hypothetical protein
LARSQAYRTFRSMYLEPSTGARIFFTNANHARRQGDFSSSKIRLTQQPLFAGTFLTIRESLYSPYPPGVVGCVL